MSISLPCAILIRCTFPVLRDRTRDHANTAHLCHDSCKSRMKRNGDRTILHPNHTSIPNSDQMHFIVNEMNASGTLMIIK